MDLLQMSLSGACIIGATVIIRAVALNRLPKQILQVFWLVACVRLLIPLSFQSIFSVYNLPELFGSYGAAPQVAVMPQTAGTIVPGGMASTPNASATGTQSPYAAVWLAGLVAVAVYLIAINIRGKRSYADSLPLQDGYACQWLAQNKLRRVVTVRVSDKITTPLTYGVINPVILLPKSMDFSDKKLLTYILTHELLHIKRFDLVKKIVLMAVVCIHWFNPMVWVMYVLANRDIELACDEGVLRALGKDTSEGYAMALIAMQERQPRASMANCFSRYAIKERITSIMKYKKISIIAIVVALALVVGVTTAFASTGKPTENEPMTDYAAAAAPAEEGTAKDVDVETEELSFMVQTDPDTGEVRYSDDGENWMTEEEYNAKYPTPDIEWWTAEAYEKWLEQERKDLQEIIGEKGWNASEGWFTWTQERVDEAIAMYEKDLQEIKDGLKHSKTVDGRDDIAVAEAPSDDAIESSIGAVITDGNGNEKAFEGYDSEEDLLKDIKEYLDSQVAAGNMTQAEADKVLNDFAH